MTDDKDDEEFDVDVFDVELKCIEARNCIPKFTNPETRLDALDEYKRLTSDAVKEALALSEGIPRDAAIRYIIDLSCEAKDFETADALLTKMVIGGHRQKAAKTISGARLEAMIEKTAT